MAGRPLKFGSVEELEKAIEDYFKNTPEDRQCVTGLALHLDTSRKVLCEYEDERPAYSNAIKKAKARVEHAYELRGMAKGRTYDIFTLKNMGWDDKSQTDLTSGGEKIVTNVIVYDKGDLNSVPIHTKILPTPGTSGEGSRS